MKKNMMGLKPDNKDTDASLAEDYQSLKIQLKELSDKYQKVLQANEKARTLVALKSDFLANMSHDLRTPLHAILSYSRFGVEKIDNIDREKIIKYFKNIEDSGRKLQEMLNKIVDLSKLESGKMVFQMYSCNLSLAVPSIVKENRELLEAKQIVVETDLPDNLDPVICDQNKILQVMSIIFKNSVHYAPEGSAVRITMENLPGNKIVPQAGLKICFKDLRTTPISQDAIDNFDTFMEKERIKTGHRIDGISLAIAYEIVKYHGGLFQVQNIPDGETTYSFTLPLEQPERQ